MSDDEQKPTTPRTRVNKDRKNIPGVTRSLAVQVSEEDFRTFKVGAATLGMKHPQFVSYLLSLLPKQDER